jgi:hypothetical protein
MNLSWRFTSNGVVVRHAKSHDDKQQALTLAQARGILTRLSAMDEAEVVRGCH